MVSRPKFSFFSSSSQTRPRNMGSAPFSIVEFGRLVALALETDGPDRFSESFLQFDPELGCREIKAAVRVADSPMTSPSPPSPSRPRRLLEKLKHKASALVLRTTAPVTPRAIFSRPASLVTAPPSPTKSARSFSSTSSASASPVTPTTDRSRWSLSTDESTASSTDDDPFAKGRVQVIRNSADYPSYTYTLAKRRSRPRPPAPGPPSPSPQDAQDWTLALPTTPPRPALARARSFLSDSSDSHPHPHPRSHCPSAWNPAPPSPPRPRPRPRATKSYALLPPRTADSTASATPTLRDRERARALAALNGEVHPCALEAFAPRCDESEQVPASPPRYRRDMC